MIPLDTRKYNPEITQQIETSIKQKSEKLWDPVGSINEDDELIRDNVNLVLYYNKFRSKPNLRILNTLFEILGFMLLTIVLTIIILLELFVFKFYLNGLDQITKTLVISIFYISIIIVYFVQSRNYDKQVDRELVEIFLAQKNNWISSPSQNSSRLSVLSRFYSYTFIKDEFYSYVTNQFWGSEIIGTKSYYFTLGVSNYQYLTEKSKIFSGHESFFYAIFKLETSVPFRFAIIPKEGFDFTTSSDLEFFEKNFTYEHAQENPNFEFLSDTLKQEIVKLYEVIHFELIEFRDNTIVISFEDNLYEVEFTNFLKTLEIDKRDIDNIEYSILEFVSCMSKVINLFNKSK